MKMHLPFFKQTKVPAKGLGLLTLAVVSFISPAQAETIITIQPHTSGDGYVVTYSWKGKFAGGMDTGSNGAANIDDNTKAFSSNYEMPSGNHTGGLIKYSQHNNDGINGNYATVPALGANPVHFDGTNGESLVPGEPMQESSHANIGFTETTTSSPDWYNNPNDYGGVRFFGTGIQGALSLTSWNGIDASSAYGDVEFEGEPLLGQGMQFGVNGSGPGAAETARFGMVGDAGYWNNLNSTDSNNGLLIGYFPYATNFPNVAPDPDKFIDQFHVGTYASGDTTMYIVNDSSHVPALVSEATPYEEWSGGTNFTDDTNSDGVADGTAWMLGADSPNLDAVGLLPVYDDSDPDFFIFTYRRSDEAISAGATATVQYTSDLTSDWTPALAGTDVIITPTNDGAATGVDTVEVKIRRTLATGDKLFVRLLVTAPAP